MLTVTGETGSEGMRRRRGAPSTKKGDMIMGYAPNFHHWDVLALAGMVAFAYLVGRVAYAISMMRRPAPVALAAPSSPLDHSPVVAMANDNAPASGMTDSDRRAA
jgi:hypothetical protein